MSSQEEEFSGCCLHWKRRCQRGGWEEEVFGVWRAGTRSRVARVGQEGPRARGGCNVRRKTGRGSTWTAQSLVCRLAALCHLSAPQKCGISGPNPDLQTQNCGGWDPEICVCVCTCMCVCVSAQWIPYACYSMKSMTTDNLGSIPNDSKDLLKA